MALAGFRVVIRQAMMERRRAGLVARVPVVEPKGEVEPDARASSGIDGACVVAGHKGQPKQAG